MDAGGRATQDAQAEGARRAGEGHAATLSWLGDFPIARLRGHPAQLYHPTQLSVGVSNL